MLSALLWTIVAAAVVGGIIYITIKGIMTLMSILQAFKKNNLKGTFKTMIDNATNTMKLSELNSMETKMEIKADGIGDDIPSSPTVIEIF